MLRLSTRCLRRSASLSHFFRLNLGMRTLGNYQPHNFDKFQLTFAGSGSVLTKARGLPCIILEIGNEYWVFDAGEGSKRQSLLSRISKNLRTRFFISNMNMENIMGLPSMLIQAADRDGAAPTPISELDDTDKVPHMISVFGPKGLYDFISYTIGFTGGRLDSRVLVHELIIDDAVVNSSYPVQEWMQKLVENSKSQSTLGSERFVIPNLERIEVTCSGNNVWDCTSELMVTVQAGLVKHPIPSFAFIVKECDKAGPMLAKKLAESFKQLTPEIRKSIKAGENVLLPDGRILIAADYLGPPVLGRKIAIVGYCSDASSVAPLSMDCDVLIHNSSYEQRCKEIAIAKGFSTPLGAVRMAHLCRARRVVLNGIGSVFVPLSIKEKFDLEKNLQAKVKRRSQGILQLEAVKAFKSISSQPAPLVIAKDFLRIKVPLGGYSPESQKFDVEVISPTACDCEDTTSFNPSLTTVSGKD